MEESRKTAMLTLTIYPRGEEKQRRKGRKIFGEGEYLFLEEKKNREGKGGKYVEKTPPKIVKDIEKSRVFCQFLQGF